MTLTSRFPVRPGLLNLVPGWQPPGERVHQQEAATDWTSKGATWLFGIEVRPDMALGEYYDKIKHENDQYAIAQKLGVAVR